LKKKDDLPNELGPSPNHASRPNHLTTATAGNVVGASDDSDSLEGEYGDEQIDVDSDAYDDELD
jgi:hypothetical protein